MFINQRYNIVVLLEGGKLSDITSLLKIVSQKYIYFRMEFIPYLRQNYIVAAEYPLAFGTGTSAFTMFTYKKYCL